MQDECSKDEHSFFNTHPTQKAVFRDFPLGVAGFARARPSVLPLIFNNL